MTEKYNLLSLKKTLPFSETLFNSLRVPTARLEIGSLSCWSPGFFTFYERMIQWLKALGATIVKEIVSEVHLAADFLQTDINTLGIQNEERWVSRVHKFNIHRDRRKLSGIMHHFGKLHLD